jgi:serine/threonine-protein kinase
MTIDLLRAALADRYRIERELGQGGMATVYLAEDLKHHRKVAVKVLRPDLAAVIWAERFLREIVTTAQLHHPHILPLYDSGLLEAGNSGEAATPYYIMPYVEGESLRVRLDREKQLSLPEALRLTSEVAEALSYAHTHGVVHRDIKPDNILLDSGHAVVTDFGIAKAVDEAGGEKLTATGLVIGTPRYMSPEQSMGEASVDSRSDVYSLGCVLFEMLAGEAPYTGATAQAIIARRMALPVPSVRILRAAVPEPVDRALTRALAKAPADRFVTVDEFREALGTSGAIPVGPAPTAGGRRARWLGVGAVLLVLLFAALGILRPWRAPSAPLDANLLVVTPFDVSDPELAVWHEGVVDFLSRTLDGAGMLRSVAPSLVVAKWTGRSDRASATVLARRVRAGLAVTGNLSRRGPDSVDIRGVLLDVVRGSALGEVTVNGPENRVGELMDSLGIGLLRTLSRDRPVAAVRRSTIGSAPLPALKAFLLGEQFYRRAVFDSALPAYAEAIARDSTLAFAYYRMGEVLGWSPVTSGSYASYDSYLALAHQHNRGLGKRDSMIIAADSAWQNGSVEHPDLYRLAIRSLNELVQAYPSDPEAWYELGEKLIHTEPGLGQDEPGALNAFDRAIALDSSFVPPWEHVLALVLRHRGIDEARRYALAFGATPATTAGTITAKLASRLLLDSTGGRGASIRSALDSAPPVALVRLGLEYFLSVPDSAETAIALLRRLDARSIPEDEGHQWWADSLMRHQLLAFALMTRGHLREAVSVDHQLLAEPGASGWSWFGDPFSPLAMLGVIPAAEVDSVYGASLQPGVSLAISNTRVLLGLPWWAARHDTAAIRLFGRRMQEAGRRAADASQRTRADFLVAASEAYLALSRGDSGLALRRFDAMPACPWAAEVVYCKHIALIHASLLAEHGAPRTAAALLDSLPATSSGALAVLARLERAEVAEQLQDRETARRDYRFVVDAWQRADPELMPYLDRARSGLDRVTGKQGPAGPTRAHAPAL